MRRGRLNTLARNHPPSVSRDQMSRLIEAARDSEPVSGYTHNFYRYPARFSPQLARAVIEAFTEPGDLVLDPFVGGGTTLVEAMALGRSAVGIDISSLATFVSEVKTTLYTDDELAALTRWALQAAGAINIHGSTVYFGEWAERGYYRHLEGPNTWRLRKAVEQALGSAIRLDTERLERFARCAILRTAQWALDARRRLPTVAEFRARLLEVSEAMLLGARELRETVRRATPGEAPRVWCLNRAVAGLEDEAVLRDLPAPRLVLTSPPYPGIHMLYHRWQVDGRKETPAPFWIANKLDGAFSSYYTLGDRQQPTLPTYFDNLRNALSSIAGICNADSTIVQVVAFSEPSWQLPRYLRMAEQAGLEEVRPRYARRIRRQVPNRRWHADQKGDTHSSKEVVLIHRLATPPLPRSETETLGPPPARSRSQSLEAETARSRS